MNAVGKILVFLNLMFSFVVGAFAVMSFVARTNYADQNEKLRNHIAVLQASSQVVKADADVKTKNQSEMMATLEQDVPKGTIDVKEPAKMGKALAALYRKQKEELDALKKRNDDLTKQLDKTRTTRDASETSMTITDAELKRHQEDNKNLRKILDDETKRNIQLVKEKNDLRDQFVIASVNARSLKTRNEQLEEELQRVAKDLLRAQNSRRPVTGTGSGGPNNPPPDQIEGLVSYVDPRGDLVTLTIGSDSGLLKDHTLEVFGLNGRTGYRGKIKLVSVSAKSAVGEVMGKLQSKIQVGDTVASSILGKQR